MADFVAEIVATNERWQDDLAQFSAEIDELIEAAVTTFVLKEAEDAQRFMADRFDVLQYEVGRWRNAQSMAECLRHLPGVQGVPAEGRE